MDRVLQSKTNRRLTKDSSDEMAIRRSLPLPFSELRSSCFTELVQMGSDG